MDNPNPNRQSMRVLSRPPAPIRPPSPPPPTPPDPSPVQPQISQNGVVVVGFIGKRHSDVTQLINRIVDANVFGSGNCDTPFRIEKQEILNEEIEEWFKCRSISFYLEEEKGILYLQFSSIFCPVMERALESTVGFDSILEDREFGDLQGMLFMFSVCHVIVYIQEGSRFDTQIFKRFRVLQAAKHAMTSYVKSRTMPPLTANARVSSSSRMHKSGVSSNNPSPGRGHGISNRNPSSSTVLHGLGSYSSLLPGQCTPVILFVFLDDVTDTNPSSSSQDQIETTSLNQSSNLSNMPRSSFPAKGSGSVVVLARPVNKLDGSLKKKLQSSLESQVRLLIKRSRILSSTEAGQSGSRSGGTSSLTSLFLLDSSRAVVLIDIASNQRGKSLECVTGLVEDVIDGKATSDSLLLESNGQNANKDDMISVKEFILRQSDILRGRGGTVSGTNSGSAAGGGMVAVAAAAAAASAASVKTYSSPELPSFETWLSSSQPILHGILSGKHGGINEAGISKGKSHKQNGMASVEGNTSKSTDYLALAVSFLENGEGLNSKFSTLWCKKALPIAKDIYLNELPPAYPTLQHEAHLKRAMLAFSSMVKGPALQFYMKKLVDECLSIWSSGRQLCDAVSLTGKPCMHNRHYLESDVPSNEIKLHSSGYVFLHACACGRSRRLREDPFDFETANFTFSSFPECDKLLPALQLPWGSGKGVAKYLSWNLIRIGGARYYNPEKGLLQSGFSTSQKFLLKWTISIGKRRSNHFPFIDAQQVLGNEVSSNGKDDAATVINVKKAVDGPFHLGDVQNALEIQRRTSSNNIQSDEKILTSSKGTSSSTMRKPFSEVVAGSVGANSGFPPLQMRKQPLPGSDKVTKHHDVKDQVLEKVKEASNNPVLQKVQDKFSTDGTFYRNTTNVESYSDGDPFLQIGSNVVPVNINTGSVLKGSASPKQVTLYVGFEHECPHGHRFILRPDHLDNLVSPGALPEESAVLSSTDNHGRKVGDHLKYSKNSGHGKARRQSVINTSLRKTRNLAESKTRDATTNFYVDGPLHISSSSKERENDAKLVSVKNLEKTFESVFLDDGGCAFNLLSRNLPIYMNCPHCQDSKRKKDTTIKFSGTISQLQRIFLVTPSFPVTLAACPVVQFEESCLPPTVPDRKEKLQFSLGCSVVLPPDSFLSLRLPFVYYVELEGGNLHPLTPFEHQPELTASITKGTTLQIVSEGSNFVEG